MRTCGTCTLCCKVLEVASLAKPAAGWEAAAFDDAKWTAATVVKKMGEAPWGTPFDGAKKAAAKNGKRTPTTSVAAADELILRPGFKAELLHLVPKPEQGTWVSLAVSPEGDLVAGDQGGVLWRISLKDPTKPVVTKIDTKFFGCHGLLFAHGALYACTSEKGKGDIDVPGGIFRLGATPSGDFVFDNEKWAHPQRLERFAIAATPTRNSDYLAFVEAGGYQTRAQLLEVPGLDAQMGPGGLGGLGGAGGGGMPGLGNMPTNLGDLLKKR